MSVPRASVDGRTYVFRLRPGVRFADGEPVRASDVRASFERLLAVNHVNPPGWYDIIAGADRCRGKRCDLSRGIVVDDRAGLVTFHLRRADPDFLYRLALPFAFVLPRATPAKILKAPVAGTGPYRIAAFVPGRRIELVRNPRFRAFAPAAAPDGYPDRIDVDVAKQDDTTVQSVLAARATLAVDVHPSPSAVRALAVRDPVQLHADQRNETTFLFLNTRVAPFDNARARRAVDFAIDRGRMARLRGGPILATPTCQILPPDFPGYRPYCPYTVRPNPAGTWIAPDTPRAKALVAASGTRGQKVVVWGLRDQASIVREVARDLRGVGYRASARTAAVGPYYARVEDSRRRTQIGVIGWTADYPSGANMLQPLFACSSFAPGDPNINNNASELCDHAVEHDMSAALATQRAGSPDPAGAWTLVDRRIVDAAAAAPLVNDLSLTVTSRGVGDYQLNPEWGPLLDQLWVR